jgi:hypothetical protein
MVSLATAAGVLLAVYLEHKVRESFRPGTSVEGPERVAVKHDSTPPPLWGWGKPEILADDLSPTAYLSQLADAATDWSKKRPEDAARLARRLGEFRQGCSRLIFATHKPLSPPDRAWLVQRCQAWGRQLDQLLEAVEGGQAIAQVRDETDILVQDIARELRARAEALKAG